MKPGHDLQFPPSAALLYGLTELASGPDRFTESRQPGELQSRVFVSKDGQVRIGAFTAKNGTIMLA